MRRTFNMIMLGVLQIVPKCMLKTSNPLTGQKSGQGQTETIHDRTFFSVDIVFQNVYGGSYGIHILFKYVAETALLNISPTNRIMTGSAPDVNKPLFLHKSLIVFLQNVGSIIVRLFIVNSDKKNRF